MTMSDDHEALRRALKHAIDYIDGFDERAIPASAALGELRDRLGGTLEARGVPAERIVDELAANVEGGLLDSGGGRFFAWAIGGALPAALASDWLTSAWDQNAAIYATSPALAVIEEVSGEWLKDVLALPKEASFAFVTGCQTAHVTALAAARQKLLSDRGYDVGARGLAGAPPIRVHTGALCHESIARACRLLGLGTDAVTVQPSGRDGKMKLDALAGVLDDGPAIVVLQAGEFNTGGFDDFERAIELAHDKGAWVHVDGALGLWAAASARYRHLMKGCERADSWATDGHKWLNLPFDTGFVFTAHPKAHRAAMMVRASYFTAGDDVRHPIDWTPEWSRRGRGVPTYAALRSLGRQGLEDLIDRSCGHARRLIEGMGALRGVEVMAEPIINQGIVRFTATDGDHDRRTDEVIDRIQRSGIAWFGGSDFLGSRVMRVPVLSFRTTDADIDKTLEAVRAALDD